MPGRVPGTRRTQQDHEHQRLEPRRDRDGRGQPVEPQRPDEEDRDDDVRDDRDERGRDRRRRVLEGVERAGQHRDQRVRREPDQERPTRAAAVACERRSRACAPRRTAGGRRRPRPRSRAPRSRPSRSRAGRRPRVTSRGKPSRPPRAASRDSDGRRTMPSGTPITPIGIWSIANAKLNTESAVRAQRRREARHDQEHDLRGAQAERARHHQQQRRARLRRPRGRRAAGSAPRSGRSDGTWTRMWPSAPSTTP